MIRALVFPILTTLVAAAPTPKTLSPAALVQKQIEAFNAHDLEALLATYSDELEVFELPGGQAAPSGKLALRTIYAERFRTLPDLHGSVQAQMVSGSYVIQRERITGRGEGKGALEAVVIYQVESGLIRRLWTLR